MVARAVANYGERRGVDMRLLTAEWHATLGAYPIDRIDRALSEHVRTSTYWPTVANLVDLMREETPAPGLPAHREAPRQFERDGRTEAEEIAFRAAQTLKWKQESGFGKFIDPIEEKQPPNPASQAQTVGYELARSCAVRRTKGWLTCEPNCSRQNCDLRAER